jgi:hypothetical protein
MTRLFTAAALSIAIGAFTLSPSVGQGFGWSGMMMGGGCPTIGMMGQGMMMGADSWGGRGRGMMGDQPRMGALISGRLAYLKAELEITDAQTAAWDAYAEAIDMRIESMQGMHSSMIAALEEGTAIERMDARIAGMEAMLEAMKALRPATESLYATLDDAQKQKADQLIGLGCGAM